MILTVLPVNLDALVTSFRRDGWCVVGELWSEEDGAALRAEALEAWPQARWAFRATYEALDGGAVLGGPIHQYWNDRGTLLHQWHESPVLIGLVERLSGRPVEPVQASYLYYRPGGFCGLHTDRREFEFQLLFAIDGELGPCVVHPELASDSYVELAQRCRERAPQGGIEVHHPRLGVTAFRGTEIPHRRPAHFSNTLGVVAGLNYRSV